MKRFIFKNEKGVSLLLAVLILNIILAIALGIAHFMSEQTKMVSEVGYSVRAFYAANAGIEEILLTENIPPPNSSNPVDGASYRIICECCDRDLKPDCPSSTPQCPESNCNPVSSGFCVAPNYCLKSIGNYRGYLRAIHVDY